MARPATGNNLSIVQLEQMLRKRRSEQQRLEKKRGKLQRQLDQLDAKIMALGGASGGRGGGRVRNEKSLNEVIAAVLGKNGKAMSVGEIEAAVRSAGYRSTSDKFRSIVNQALIKDKRFGAASRGMYQLKK